MKKINIVINFISIFLPMIVSLPLMGSNNSSISATGAAIFMFSISMIIIFLSNNKQILIPIEKLNLKFIIYTLFIALANFVIVNCIVCIAHFFRIGNFSVIDNSINLNIISIVSIIIIGPICEELFFRVAILNVLLKRLPSYIAIILQGTFFAFIHCFSIKSVTFYITIIGGLILGYIFYYTKSILYSILCHITYNALSILFYNYTFYSKSTIIFICYVLLLIISLVLTVLGVRKLKKHSYN